MTESVPLPPLAPVDNPAARLEAHYRKVLAERIRDLPFIHPGLAVEAVGFTRCQGDWLGVVITPWFLKLFLIAGGGHLWGDIPAGQRRYVDLPGGTLQFLADGDPDLGPYQYCPLIAPVTALADQAAARQAAVDALRAALGVPAATDAPATPAPDDNKKDVSRRGFLRSLMGRR